MTSWELSRTIRVESRLTKGGDIYRPWATYADLRGCGGIAAAKLPSVSETYFCGDFQRPKSARSHVGMGLISLA